MTLKKLFAASFVAALVVTGASASTVYEASTADRDPAYSTSPGGHSLYLNGAKYSFEVGARWIEDGNKASLTGSLVNGDGTAGYMIDLSFDKFVASLPKAKRELKNSAYVENGGPVDVSTWRFWDLIEGGVSRLIGTGANIGLEFDMISKPISEKFAFQSGIGANGKNINEGVSGWLFLEGTNDASRASGLCSAAAKNTCDINIDISTMPLPASSLLLIGGVAAFAGLRRRKRAA